MDQIKLLKRAKRTIRNFCVNALQDGIVTLGITDIEAEILDSKKEGFDYAVTVTLERPGLLIGKGGKIIDELTKILSEELEGDVKMYIHESSLWKNLY